MARVFGNWRVLIEPSNLGFSMSSNLSMLAQIFQYRSVGQKEHPCELRAGSGL